MASFDIQYDQLKDFISSMGKSISDLTIDIDESGISASVGADTHYLYRHMDCTSTQCGKVFISDLPKVKAYLNTVKQGVVSVTQSGNTETLHLVTDSSSLQIPTSSYIQSQDKVPLLKKLVDSARDSMWSQWSYAKLDYHATVSADSLKAAVSFNKILGSSYVCKTEFDPAGEELVVRGGSKTQGRMYVRASLSDVKSPAASAHSAFDKWLPDLLNNLPSGRLNLYTGDDTVMIFHKANDKFVMVVLDQEAEEGE